MGVFHEFPLWHSISTLANSLSSSLNGFPITWSKSEADKFRTFGKFRGLQKTIWQIVGSPSPPLNLVRFLLSFTKKTPKNQPSEDVSLIKNGDFPLQNLSLQGDKPLVHKKNEQFCLKPLVECWRRSKVRKYLVAELKKPGPHPSSFDKKLV